MKSKVSKYLFYIIKFIKSDNKGKVVGELYGEVRKKGIVRGIQSLLHTKTYGSGNDTDFGGTSGLSIRKYDKNVKITLPAPEHPLISIIIPMYNQVDYTCNCICSIFENNQLDNYEIIIADDHSKENTDILKENFHNLTLLTNQNNLGFLRNCNLAAAKARGKYIVFLNNDTQVQQNWLQELLYCFEQIPGTGIAGSKLIYPDGRLQEAGGVLWQDGSGMNYGNTDNPRRSEYSYIKEVDYISGASIMITNDLWKSIGGFDEAFSPAYAEDSDLCMQVRRKGYKVIYQPFSEVVHFEGVSHGTALNTGVKQYQLVNQKKLYDKWREELKKKSKKNHNVFCERDRSCGKKHVLVVDHYLPTIDKDAGSRTITNFIDSMLGLGYHVQFLGENQSAAPENQKAFQQKGVEVLYGSRFYFVGANWKHYILEKIDKLDAILLSRSSVCTPIIAFLKKRKYKGNIIYYGHDLGFLRLEKEALMKNDQSLVSQARKIKAQEDYMYNTADNSLICSTEELKYLNEYIKKPLHYIPPYFFEVTDAGRSYEEREGLLFVGGFNHPPNQDAMRWFLDEVYEPLHQQHIPLTIAGSKMPEFIFEYKPRFDLLRVLPDVSVDELNSLYSKTRVVIVPLLSGAGVKGKVIEAMANGVPIVGTGVAFEGLMKDDGFLYQGQDTASGFADELKQIYDDAVYWKQLSAFGKDYVRKNFSSEKMSQVLKQIIG